jgi:hypothetical protein
MSEQIEQTEPSMMELLAERAASSDNPYRVCKRTELTMLLCAGSYIDRRGNRITSIEELNRLTWQSCMDLLVEYTESISRHGLGPDVTALINSHSDYIRNKILGEDRDSDGSKLVRAMGVEANLRNGR